MSPEAFDEPMRLTAELLEWARQHFNEDDFLAQLREVQKTGGYELKDFIQELEREAERRE